MFVALSLFVGVFAVSFLLAELGSARSRAEERVYLRYAMRKREVEYGGAPNAPIMSTDDHYLHPNRARPAPHSEARGPSALVRTT